MEAYTLPALNQVLSRTPVTWERAAAEEWGKDPGPAAPAPQAAYTLSGPLGHRVKTQHLGGLRSGRTGMEKVPGDSCQSESSVRCGAWGGRGRAGRQPGPLRAPRGALPFPEEVLISCSSQLSQMLPWNGRNLSHLTTKLLKNHLRKFCFLVGVLTWLTCAHCGCRSRPSASPLHTG